MLKHLDLTKPVSSLPVAETLQKCYGRLIVVGARHAGARASHLPQHGVDCVGSQVHEQALCQPYGWDCGVKAQRLELGCPAPV